MHKERAEKCQEAMKGQTIDAKFQKKEQEVKSFSEVSQSHFADPENRVELLTLAWGNNWLAMSRKWRGVKTSNAKECD